MEQNLSLTITFFFLFIHLLIFWWLEVAAGTDLSGGWDPRYLCSKVVTLIARKRWEWNNGCIQYTSEQFTNLSADADLCWSGVW